MSADLQWAIIRKNNSFLVQNKLGDKALFSKETNNLTNKHSFKFSGLVNAKAIGVQGDGKKGVVVSVKSSKNVFKPKQAVKKVALLYGGRKALHAVGGLAAGAGQPDYRADLKKAALARASAVLASQKTKTAKVRHGRKTKKATKA